MTDDAAVMRLAARVARAAGGDAWTWATAVPASVVLSSGDWIGDGARQSAAATTTVPLAALDSAARRAGGALEIA